MKWWKRFKKRQYYARLYGKATEPGKETGLTNLGWVRTMDSLKEITERLAAKKPEGLL